jgi:hypothetical protein
MGQNRQFGRRAYPPQEPRGDLEMESAAGTVSPPWKWAITAAIAAVLLLATYGVTTHRDEQVAANPPATTGSVPAPAGNANRPGG